MVKLNMLSYDDIASYLIELIRINNKTSHRIRVKFSNVGFLVTHAQFGAYMARVVSSLE
jgi:hypothetical protein